MKYETLLDSVVFQLSDGRTRCELWITAGESSEKLASGSLAPFVSHLEAARRQMDRGASAIKLQAPPPPRGCQWFNKGTIERFVRFVSTPDVLERVSALETERLKLAEASNILVSAEPSAHGSSASTTALSSVVSAGTGTTTATSGGGGNHRVDKFEIVQRIQAENPLLECPDSMEAETSKKHLINAMDARRLILEKEQSKAFVCAAAAGFHMDSISDLISFSNFFGATQLREACLKFSTMHKRLKGLEEFTMAESEEGSYRAPEVKVHGRRRVWGPPVVDISPQKPNCTPDPGKKPGTPRWKADDCSDQLGSSSSGHSDSDWDDTDDNSKRPLYANVIAELELKNKIAAPPPVEEPKVEPEVELEVGTVPVQQLQQQKSAAVPRKGIVVIRNVNSVRTEGPSKVSEEESDNESDKEGAEVKRPGRLSVQDAIHLFENKQKEKIEARKNVGTKPCSPGGEKTRVFIKENPGFLTSPRGSNVEDVRGSSESYSSGAGAAVHTAVQSTVPATVKPSSVCTNKIQAEASGLLAETSTEAERVDVSKDVLDRSYSCLLKINSVVQDALFSRQAQEIREEQPEWRSATSSSLDDIFISSSKVLSAGSTRRQSLSTPTRYNAMSAAAETPTKTTRRNNAVALPDHQKGRLYEQYQEIREAKKRERLLLKTEREEKLKAMQDVLERRKFELKTSSTRLPAKLNTMGAEEMHAMKSQASRTSSSSNVLRTTARKDVRPPDSKMNAEIAARKSPGGGLQRNQLGGSRTPTTSRKSSPGPKPVGLPASKNSRAFTSPQSRNNGNGFTSSNSKRSAGFMSQSVIAENISPAPLRKENARPLLGRNSMVQVQNSRYLQPVKPLDSNRTARQLPDTTARKYRENTAPPIVAAARAAANGKYQVSGRFRHEHSVPVLKTGDEQPKVHHEVVKMPKVEVLQDEVVKPNDECIKQIVSCVNKDRLKDRPPPPPPEIEPELKDVPVKEPPLGLVRSVSDLRYDASTSNPRVGSFSLEVFKMESFQEQVEEDHDPPPLHSSELYRSDSKNFDDEVMQIDEERSVEKSRSFGGDHLCTSRSLKEVLPTKDRLPAAAAAVVTSKDDQPRGLKRFLKFGRKIRTSAAADWDGNDQQTVAKVRETSVRRSLESLPEISTSKNFFASQWY